MISGGKIASVLVSILVIVPGTAAAKDAHPIEVSGIARIVDGDTIEVDGHKIRLAGMDAPEGEQVCRDELEKVYRCGRSATEALTNIIAKQVVVCHITGTDRYRRFLAQCATPRTRDVGLEMVRIGWATIYDGRPTLPGYAAAEASARHQKIGIWRGSFERPSAWRRQHSIGWGGGHA